MDERFKDWLSCIPREESRLCPITDWEPAADVYQTGGGWLIKFDLSGVRPEDVQVTVEGRCLSIAGTRRDHSQQVGVRYYRMEIAYNRFQRTIELPSDVDANQITSQFEDGMLLVRLDERKSQ